MRITLDLILRDLDPIIEAEIDKRITGEMTLNELYKLAQELRELSEQPYAFKDLLQLVFLQSLYNLGHLG